jgi:hypothetical protein
MRGTDAARWTATVVAAAGLAGCAPDLYHPARATRPYPFSLHRAEAADIQVFRRGTSIEIVNFTPRTYRGFDLWLNQRYVRHVEELPAGGTISLSLWEFYDERGEVINAGGFFRTHDPTPIALAEIQPGADEPMIGLVTIAPGVIR